MVILFASVMILSYILEIKHVSVTYEEIEKVVNQKKDLTVSVQNLLVSEGIKYIFESLTTNFTSLVALGTVLVAML